MERLTIDEVIAHCQRHTDRVERSAAVLVFKEGNMPETAKKQYLEHKQVKEWLEELKEYKAAEEQGLLLRLPVAIGQTVYTNHSMQGWYCRSSNRPYEAEVVYIGLNNCEESGGGYINISFKQKKGYMLSFTFKEIGITWFLTKEEAEQALKQEGENERI